MNLTTLINPLLQLAPSPFLAGHSESVPDLDLQLVDGLAPSVAHAVEGIAGDAISQSLGAGAGRVHQAIAAGQSIDEIARQGEHAVQEAIAGITVIAQECLQDVVGAVTSSSLLGGPLGMLSGPQVALIVEERKIQAHDRLIELGRELQLLTADIAAVQVPEAPRSPSDASAAAPGNTGVPSSAEAPQSVAPEALASPSADSVAEFSGESAETNSEDVAGAPSPQAAAAVQAARSAMGTPYQWGGTAPGSGFDCSGLTQWAYAQAGVDIPRTAQEQAVGTPVSKEQLLPGDLVVWDGHVAMVAEDGQMIEAGDPVQLSPIRTENVGMNFLGFYRPTG